ERATWEQLAGLEAHGRIRAARPRRRGDEDLARARVGAAERREDRLVHDEALRLEGERRRHATLAAPHERDARDARDGASLLERELEERGVGALEVSLEADPRELARARVEAHAEPRRRRDRG